MLPIQAGNLPGWLPFRDAVAGLPDPVVQVGVLVVVGALRPPRREEHLVRIEPQVVPPHAEQRHVGRLPLLRQRAADESVWVDLQLDVVLAVGDEEAALDARVRGRLVGLAHRLELLQHDDPLRRARILDPLVDDVAPVGDAHGHERPQPAQPQMPDSAHTAATPPDRDASCAHAPPT